MSARRVRVAAIPAVGERLTLDPGASHHLLVVCRHPRDGAVVLFDGAGGEASARLDGVVRGDDGVQRAIVVAERVGRQTARSARHLVLGLPKGPAADQAVRMAVEVGVSHVHPVLAARSVAKGDHADRWHRIAVAAAEQCGRADVPVIAPVGTLTDAVAALAAVPDRRVGVPGAPIVGPAQADAAFAVGPEGGFTEREVLTLLDAGWSAVGIAAHVLRVDTAVAVGLASLGFDG